jgi:replicative DNA helicase
LDNSTGGYDEGGVFVFSGRAKTGKTMLMIYSLNSLLERFPDSKILFLSMEMTTVQVLQRLACLRGHVNPKSLRIGDISSLAERRLIESLGPIADRLIVSEGKLETDIASVIGMIGTTQPLIVFIDGAYLLKTTAPSGALWEKVKEVIETLKRVAINFRVPIVCSYQLKRGSKANPDLEYLALSDAIGQIASFVMGIIDVDIPNTRKVEIMGVREGVKDSFFINWDWENLDFSERDFTQ